LRPRLVVARTLVRQRERRIIPPTSPEEREGSVHGDVRLVDLRGSNLADIGRERGLVVLQLTQDGTPLQRREFLMVTKDPRIDPQADGNRTELHHQTIEQLVPQFLHGVRLEVELACGTFWSAQQPVNDLS
jgi:hypothetical protein